MKIEDIHGIGKASIGIAKLLNTVKDFCIWTREFSRFKNIMAQLGDNDLKPDQINYETPNMKLALSGLNTKNKNPNHVEVYTEVALQSKEAQTLKEQLNKDKVLIYAANNLQDTTDVSEDKVDEEWLANFFEHTKFATSEYMQKLWGKILADEVKQPNSYSIRALNTLRVLKKTDAEKFSKMCNLLLSNCNKTYHRVIYDSKYFYEKFNITDSDLSYLEEIGLIQSTSLEYPAGILIDNDNAIFTYGGKKVFWYERKNLPAAFLDIPFFNITHLGKELLRLVIPEFQNDYINVIHKNLIKQNKEYKISVADFNAIEFIENKLYVNRSYFTKLEPILETSV